MALTIEEIRDVLSSRRDELMSKPNVFATGIGYKFTEGKQTDRLMTENMRHCSDSGSAVLDNNNYIVGLLFAGSSTTTLTNRIQDVFSELSVSLP